MNADGSDQARLTDNLLGNYFPSWSPDGKRIAFTSERDGNSEIYIMNADGSGQIRLTNNKASDGMPTWSPDGKRIVFCLRA
jgi:TolB protein